MIDDVGIHNLDYSTGEYDYWKDGMFVCEVWSRTTGLNYVQRNLEGKWHVITQGLKPISEREEACLVNMACKLVAKIAARNAGISHG
jgi:hypothetical protein